MKKFLALVMALCMVCMTVAVASAANSSPKGASITGVAGTPLAVTDIGETKVNSGDNVTAFSFTALTEDTQLKVELPAVMSNATLSVYCLVSAPNTPAAFFDAGKTWKPATNVSLNGTTLTFTAPAGAVAVAVVENAGGSSAGTATAGASGADVTAPKTNDVPVELILGLGVVMFAGVAVACKRRAA